MEHPNGQYIKTSNGWIYIAPGIELRKPEPITEPLPPLTAEESRLLLEHATWKGEIETADWR